MTKTARIACVLGAAGLVAFGLAAPAAAQTLFQWRGVVEGEYGQPWDHAARMRMLGFLGNHGFNAYVHAPKRDPYIRTQWRDAYPAAQQAQFKQEITLARGLGVDWIPDVSPAVPQIPTPPAPGTTASAPICFSCPDEVNVLVQKFLPFLSAGTNTVMVSFDDTRKELTYPQDVAAYGNGEAAYGAATGDLLTRLLAQLRTLYPSVHLLTVGADYNGTSDTPYLAGLRWRLDRSVEVMWTGPNTGSRNFSPNAAAAYGTWIGRQPILWDNWTVDDRDGNINGMTHRIHLGYYPRTSAIVGKVRGIFLNPMNEADLNKLPYLTAADYLANPYHYKPRCSYARAVTALGGVQAQALRAFAEVNASDRFDATRDAPTFVSLSNSFLRAYGGALWQAPLSNLNNELSLTANAVDALSAMPSLDAFVSQADPFLAAASTAAHVASDGTALLAAERPTLTVRRTRKRGFAGQATAPNPALADSARLTLTADDATMLADPRYVYGYRGTILDTPSYPAPPNKMDVFVQQVQSLDSAWTPLAAQAAASVRVTLDGRPVRLGAGGTFRLPAKAKGHVLIAFDGTGHATGVRLGSSAPAAPNPLNPPGCFPKPKPRHHRHPTPRRRGRGGNPGGTRPRR